VFLGAPIRQRLKESGTDLHISILDEVSALKAGFLFALVPQNLR
jgi:hypothetical protein